jgi:hypothetical protein
MRIVATAKQPSSKTPNFRVAKGLLQYLSQLQAHAQKIAWLWEVVENDDVSSAPSDVDIGDETNFLP